MSDSKIFHQAIELTQSGQRFALASIIRAFGSTPQKAGASALFCADGRMWGTLGGGCLEAECRRKAMDSLDTNEAQIFDIKLDDIQGWDDGLICGGRVQVLINPHPERNLKAYKALIRARQDRLSGMLLTFLRHDIQAMGRSEFMLDQEMKNEFDEAQITKIKRLISANRTKAFCQEFSENQHSENQHSENRGTLFVEPFQNLPQLIIAGAGHIGEATSHLASLVGFEVIVIDDRPKLACPEHLPDADQTLCGDIPSEMARLKTGEDSYIVIVTRGHRHDGKVLSVAIKKPAAFIGMIGSRRKGRMIRRALLEKGLATKSELDRVCSPIGLDIGSVSVQEIAMSITAQLVAVRRRKRWGAPSMNYGFEDHSNRSCSRRISPNGLSKAASPLGK